MQLTEPCNRHQEAFLEFLEGVQKEGYQAHLDLPGIRKDFAGYLQQVKDDEDPAKLKPGWVPQTMFWMEVEGEFVGTISLRHHLNAFLREFGGHIGYGVHPRHRGKGFASQALRLVLDHARSRGLGQVMLTCDDQNLASRRVIEKNGGVLESIYPFRDHPDLIRRYWITL